MPENIRSAPAKRPRDRKATILASASRLFYERGFAGVGVGDIAAEVGISAPAMYRHYVNKTQVLVAAIDSQLVELERTVAAAPNIDELAGGLARLTIVDRRFGILIVREATHLLPHAQESVVSRLIAVVDAIGALIGQDRPDLSEPVRRVLARSALGVSVAMAFNPKRAVSASHALRIRSAVTAVCAAPLEDAHLETAGIMAATRQPRPWLSREQAILAVAPGLLATNGGYEATTLDDLGAALDMAPSGIYTYFESKAAVFTEATERGVRWANADLERAMAGSTSAEDLLDRAVSSFVDFARWFSVFALPADYLGAAEPESQVATLIARNLELWDECVRAGRPDLDIAGREALTYTGLALVNSLLQAGDGVGPVVRRSVATDIALHVMRSI